MGWDSIFKKEGRIFHKPHNDLEKIIKILKKINAHLEFFWFSIQTAMPSCIGVFYIKTGCTVVQHAPQGRLYPQKKHSDVARNMQNYE